MKHVVAVVKKFFLQRRVILATFVLGIACECYLATLGVWFLRPIALFLALAMTHLLGNFFVVWRTQDQHRQSEAFFTKFVKPMMDRVIAEADDDDEDHDPANVN